MRIVFVVGPHGSGKTAAAKKIIADNENGVLIDAGPIIRSVHQSQSPHTSISDWVCEEEKKNGPEFTDDIVFKAVKKKILCDKNFNLVIITGYRTLSGLRYLESRLKEDVEGSFCLVYINSDEELLRKRYNKREAMNLSQSEFREILSTQEKKLLELMLVSDFVINNNGAIGEYVSSLDAIIASLD